MNIVKYFDATEYDDGMNEAEKKINAYAKKNGLNPISIAINDYDVMVVFEPIDYSNQTGSKG